MRGAWVGGGGQVCEGHAGWDSCLLLVHSHTNDCDPPTPTHPHMDSCLLLVHSHTNECDPANDVLLGLSFSPICHTLTHSSHTHSNDCDPAKDVLLS